MYAVWEVVVFVLNVLAFILVGLQLKPILQRLSVEELLAHYLGAAAAGLRRRHRRPDRLGDGLRRGRPAGSRRRADRYPVVAPAVIAWCGMRGS